MLKSILIRNFKSLGEDSGILNLAPITVLIGPNSSGKSSYIKALLTLKQTFENNDTSSALTTNSNYVQLGSYADFIFKHNNKNTLDIGLNFRFNVSLTSLKNNPLLRKVNEIIDFTKTFRYEIQFYKPGEVISIKSVSLFQKNKTVFSLIHRGKGSYEFQSDFFNIPEKNRSRSFRPTVICDIPYQLLSEIDDDVLTRIDHLLYSSFSVDFDNLYYVGPLREYPHRFYVNTGSKPSDVGIKGENTYQALVLSRKSDYFNERVNYWLSQFGFAHTFNLHHFREGPFSLLIENPYIRTNDHVVDVGFGVSQILPIIVAAFYTKPKSTIMIEQPEIHLHPKVQAQLADMLIDASLNKSFIIETHSEHLITRLQRRIAEGKLSSNSVNMYFCEMGAKGTILKKIEINEYGQFENWPSNFFDDSEDHFAILKAAAKKNRKE